MRVRDRFLNLCRTVLADTLADLSGLLDEARTESGTVRPRSGDRGIGRSPTRPRHAPAPPRVVAGRPR